MTAGGKLTWEEGLPCVILMLTVRSLEGRQSHCLLLVVMLSQNRSLFFKNLPVISSPSISMCRLTRVGLWYAASSAQHSGIFDVLNVLCGNSVKMAILPAQPAARSSPRDVPHV